MAEQVAKLTYVIDVQNDTQQGVEKLNKGFSRIEKTLSNIAKLAVGAYGIKRLATFGREVLKVNDNIRLASTAFKNFNRLTSEEFEQSLNRMRKAASGTLSDVELLQKANLAKMFKIQTPIEKVIELSRKQARIMGQDVEFIFNSVVTGIGRKSKMILDNFGVIMDTTTAEKQLAEDLGKTVDELTDKEKDRAFELAAIKGLQDSVARSGIKNFETFEDKIARLNVQFEKLKGKIGKALSPEVLKIYEFWNKTFTEILNKSTKFNEGLNARKEKVEEFNQRINSLQEKRNKLQEKLNFALNQTRSISVETKQNFFEVANNQEKLNKLMPEQQKTVKELAVYQRNINLLIERENKLAQERSEELGKYTNTTKTLFEQKEAAAKKDKQLMEALKKSDKEEETRRLKSIELARKKAKEEADRIKKAKELEKQKLKDKRDLERKQEKEKRDAERAEEKRQRDAERKQQQKIRAIEKEKFDKANQLEQFQKLKDEDRINNIENEKQKIIEKYELEIQLAKKKFSLLTEGQFAVVKNILMKEREAAIKALPGSDPTELEIAKENLRKFWTETEDIALQGYSSLTNMSTTFSNAFQDQAKMFITTGKTSNKEFRKILQDQVAIEASAIASKSMINSLFELGKGFAMMFVNPAEAATHFKSAAIFKSVGTAVAAIAGGRAISQMLGGSSLQESGSGADTSALTDRNVGTERIQEITKRNKIVIEVNNSNVVGENGMQQFAEIIRDNIQTNNEVNDTQIVFQ